MVYPILMKIAMMELIITEKCTYGTVLFLYDTCISGATVIVVMVLIYRYIMKACDDGASNSDTADACRINCSSPSCGDGIKDTNESCDDGANNSDTADACRINCSSPSCGDGIKDTNESCDDGS